MLVSQCDTERTPYKSLFEVDGIVKASEINCTTVYVMLQPLPLFRCHISNSKIL